MTVHPHRRPATINLALIANIDGKNLRFDGLLTRPVRSRSAAGHRLQIAIEGETVSLRLQRQDGREMDIDHVEFEIQTPLLNFDKIVLPDSGREFLFKDRAVFLRSAPSGVNAPNDGLPFLAFTDQTGRVSAAFGLVSYTRESRCYCLEPKLSTRKAMLGGADWVVMRFRAPAEGWHHGRTKRLEETVFVGAGYRTWFHALRTFSGHYRRRHRVAYPAPPAAWEPTWCTWTAWCSDLMTPERVLANARIARDLGIGTIILDDGWFGPGLDTDDRPLNIGDYGPDAAKLPDLGGLVREIHGLGQKVLLWYAPTCIAPTSRAFAGLQAHVIHSGGKPVLAPNGFNNLCPCNPEVRRHVCRETARMLDEYGADGFKVDLYNTLPVTPCDNPHVHDENSMIAGVRRMMREMWAVVRARRPDALLELKQNYANPIGAQFGTMVRAGDTAYDVNTNLERCAYIQAYGPVVHNDYLACSTEDSPRDVAIMMIKMLTAGVPTFSLDLPRQPRATRRVIGAWLAFYRERLGLWKAPREPLDGHLDTWCMGTRREAMISVTGRAAEVRVPAAPVWWLMNGTGRHGFHLLTAASRRVCLTWYDHNLAETGRRRVTLRDRFWLDVVPGGCVRVASAGMRA